MTLSQRIPTLALTALAAGLLGGPARALGADEHGSVEESRENLITWIARQAFETKLPEVVHPAVEALRLLRDPAAPPIDELAGRIDATEPLVLDHLLESLEARRVPGLGQDEPQVLSVFQEDLILEVFTRAGPASVHSAIDRLQRPEDAPPSAAVIAAIGAVGGSNDLRDLFTLALPEDATEFEPLVAEALEDAIVSIAGRNADAFDALSALVHRARLEVLPVVVAAVGRTRDSRGIELLGDALAQDDTLAAQVAGQVRLLGASQRLEVNQVVADALRPHFEDGTPTMQRSVMLALAELEDYHCLPTLIELLDSENEGLRDNALWSLRRMTELGFGAQRSRWEAWHQAELTWAHTEYRLMRMRLNSNTPARVAEAVLEFSRHRLFRHELALDVEGVLDHPKTSLRIAACETLAQLGSVHSMPALIDQLGDPRSALRDAAQDALSRISGLDLPADQERWLAALGRAREVRSH